MGNKGNKRRTGKARREQKQTGRPRKEFDMTEVEHWGYIGLSVREMAGMAKVHKDTIQRRMRDRDSEFYETYQRGFTKGNKSIKLSQLQSAKSGNVTMQIWLGKQRLGQSDRPSSMGPEDRRVRKIERTIMKSLSGDISVADKFIVRQLAGYQAKYETALAEGAPYDVLLPLSDMITKLMRELKLTRASTVEPIGGFGTPVEFAVALVGMARSRGLLPAPAENGEIDLAPEAVAKDLAPSSDGTERKESFDAVSGECDGYHDQAGDGGGSDGADKDDCGG